MPARKRTPEISPKRADFFSPQLKGEQPLTFATAERLYWLAAALIALRPWSFMGDAELFLIEDPISRQTCYCSVMGAMGEVFSLHAYVGDESYRFLRKVIAGEAVTPAEFYATHTGVSIEYVDSGELTPPDREMLRALGHPFGKKIPAPMFRSYRPGYYPWYPTEREGVTLAACMHGLKVLAEILLADKNLYYWDEPDVYPRMKPMQPGAADAEYTVEMEKVDVPPRPAQPVSLDEARLRRIREKDYTVAGALEADYFNSGMAVGGKNERNAAVPVALVADAASGFLFSPQLGEPGQSPAEVLSLAIMNAIEELRSLPQEIRVQSQEFQQMLTPLMERLGIAVQTAKSLPMIKEARKAFVSYMGR